MSLYSRGTFGKDSFQWTKCVVKYVLDVYATASLSMISFLVEVGQHSLLIILKVYMYTVVQSEKPKIYFHGNLF